MPDEYKDFSPGLIQSADLPPDGGKPRNRAIKDADQAKQVIQTLIAANRNRQIVNSRITAKWNAERPYEQCKLEAEGLGWRSNFTTKPLAALIDKIHPRFSEAVALLKYLTNSSLSDKWENSVEKTEKFRDGVTKLFRNYKGWRNLVEEISVENSLFGSAVVAHLDEFGFFPKAFKQDSVFLSDGTKQSPDFAQVLSLKEQFLPHELFALITDKEAAIAAGWNIENTVKAINAASPAQLRQDLGNTGALAAYYQNAQRELTVGASYMAGASVVNVYNLFAQEADGKVSHYRLGGESMDELFSKEDRFESMTACIAFFSYQRGNGTMHGSKGVGREAYELAAMQDRLRNEVVDRSIMSGKQLIQGPVRDLHKFKMSILGSMCIIPQGWQVLAERIDGDVEPFLRLDAYFQQLADQLVGSVSPKVLEGERVTAAQVNLFAAREEESRDTKINRFLEFFTDMVQGMQRRACSKDTDSAAAKAFQKKMLELMTPEELKELSESPVAGTVRDLTPIQRQLIVSLAAEKRGNPLYNARQLEVEDLNARIDQDFAKRVLLPVNDKTEQAEQQRLQQFELTLTTSGQPVPVSPRDNHQIHAELLMPFLEQMGAALQAGDAGTAGFEATVAHLAEHLQNMQAQGAPKEAVKAVEDFVKKAMPIIAQLNELDAQAEQVHNATQAEGQQPEEVLQ
jgi:hypothetical protein